MTEGKKAPAKGAKKAAGARKKGVPNGVATRFRSGTEAVEMGKKGGVASGEARREKKIITEIVLRKLAEKLEGSDCTAGEAVVDSIIAQAMAGDVKAFVALADRAEGKPTQQINVAGDVSVSSALLAARGRVGK